MHVEVLETVAALDYIDGIITAPLSIGDGATLSEMLDVTAVVGAS